MNNLVNTDPMSVALNTGSTPEQRSNEANKAQLTSMADFNDAGARLRARQEQEQREATWYEEEATLRSALLREERVKVREARAAQNAAIMSGNGAVASEAMANYTAALTAMSDLRSRLVMEEVEEQRSRIRKRRSAESVLGQSEETQYKKDQDAKAKVQAALLTSPDLKTKLFNFKEMGHTQGAKNGLIDDTIFTVVNQILQETGSNLDPEELVTYVADQVHVPLEGIVNEQVAANPGNPNIGKYVTNDAIGEDGYAIADVILTDGSVISKQEYNDNLNIAKENHAKRDHTLKNMKRDNENNAQKAAAEVAQVPQHFAELRTLFLSNPDATVADVPETSAVYQAIREAADNRQVLPEEVLEYNRNMVDVGMAEYVKQSILQTGKIPSGLEQNEEGAVVWDGAVIVPATEVASQKVDRQFEVERRDNLNQHNKNTRRLFHVFAPELKNAVKIAEDPSQVQDVLDQNASLMANVTTGEILKNIPETKDTNKKAVFTRLKIMYTYALSTGKTPTTAEVVQAVGPSNYLGMLEAQHPNKEFWASKSEIKQEIAKLTPNDALPKLMAIKDEVQRANKVSKSLVDVVGVIALGNSYNPESFRIMSVPEKFKSEAAKAPRPKVITRSNAMENVGKTPIDHAYLAEVHKGWVEKRNELIRASDILMNMSDEEFDKKAGLLHARQGPMALLMQNIGARGEDDAVGSRTEWIAVLSSRALAYTQQINASLESENVQEALNMDMANTMQEGN